ncbi:MAG: RidA family protein [Vicinamibacterales bacterium]
MRQAVTTAAAPNAIGPYSQAVVVGSLVFVSGQIPLEPESGHLVGGDITAQTHQVLKNLSAILTAAESSLDQVVRTTIFLVDLGDFAVVNDVYSRYFDSPAPARTTVQVSRLPRDARIEIDAIAARSV